MEKLRRLKKCFLYIKMQLLLIDFSFLKSETSLFGDKK